MWQLIAMGGLFALIGALAFPWGIVVLVRERRGSRTLTRVTGVVVELRLGTGSRFRDLGPGRPGQYHPVITFPGPSGPVTFVSTFGSLPSIYQVGESVPVRHPPGRPDAAQLDTAFTTFLHAVPLIVGFIFLLLGVGMILGALRFGGP